MFQLLPVFLGLFDSTVQKLMNGFRDIFYELAYSNLSNMLSDLNEKVATISTELSTAPDAWQGGTIWELIVKIAEQVALPVAGTVFTFVVLWELISMLVQPNNLADIDFVSVLMKWLIKTIVAAWFISNALTICNCFLEKFAMKSFKDVVESGLTPKNFITPTSFDFRAKDYYKIGDMFATTNFLVISAPEISDEMLADILNMEDALSVTMHIDTLNQTEAMKYIKGKLSDINKMKIEEQKKAIRSGYDMDIIPPDIETYSEEAHGLLKEMQSRNERLFKVTFLITSFNENLQKMKDFRFILQDLYNELLSHKEDLVSQHIAQCMYLYVEGSNNLFNHHTNVDLQRYFSP